MKVDELTKFREELEELLGDVQDIRIRGSYIIINKDYFIDLDSLLKLKEYFGVENLYVEKQRDGVKIVVQ